MKRLTWFLIALTLITLLISSRWELSQSRAKIQTYVKLWEDDLAQERLVQKSNALYSKIITQINTLGVDVQIEQRQCYFPQVVTINYDLMRVGDLRICHRVSSIALNTLTSPLTILVLFIILVFGLWISRREARFKLEQQLLEHELHLQRELVVFARQVAHDIRSPLTALKMLPSFGQGLNQDFKDLLQGSVSRLQAIADDLLETKQQQITAEFHVPVRLESLVKEWSVAHPGVVVTIEDEFKGFIHLDVIKMERILVNLLNNSQEAQAQSICMRIYLDQARGTLEITDNGSGFPFEMLTRAGTRGLTSKKSGHGLGLSDAIQTVQAWGGEIQIENLEKGSRLQIIFPTALFKRDA